MDEKIIIRLFLYLDYKKIPHTRFEKSTGLSNGYLKTQLKRNADLGEGVIKKIVDNCLDMNIEWLISGKGEMLKTKASKEPDDTNKDLLNKVVELSEEVGRLKYLLKRGKESDSYLDLSFDDKSEVEHDQSKSITQE